MNRRNFLKNIFAATTTSLLVGFTKPKQPKPEHVKPIIREDDEVVVPVFKIATKPQIRLSDVKRRKFYITDGAGKAQIATRSYNGIFSKENYIKVIQ